LILLSVDVETTGLDINKDRVIEVGAVLFSTGQSKCLESSGYLVKSDVPVSEEITKLTGISQAAIDKFGYESEDALDGLLDMMSRAEAMIGQNVIRFDKRMIHNWASRHGKTLTEKLWIDTRTDLPGVEGKTLSYMAADKGFLNLFPHSALADCQTVLKLLEGHNIDDIVARAQSPVVILKAHVSYETNALAKKRRYGWNPEHKLWYKIVKQMDVAAETSHNEFDVSFVEGIPVEALMYS
jgi:DNA polymerase III subunit epsilon